MYTMQSQLPPDEYKIIVNRQNRQDNGGGSGVHLGKQTAVDESLYHYITNRMNDPAATIAWQLKHLTLQKYVNTM